jgi:hypothetical protein
MLCGTERGILFHYEEKSNGIYETMPCGRTNQANENPGL